jgi:Tfp pilus assembly protein PilO
MAINLEKLVGKMADFLSRFFTYIAIFFGAVVLIVGYLLLIQPKWNEVRETGIFDYNKEVKNKEEAEKYLARLKSSLEKFKGVNSSDIEKLKKSLPPEEGIGDLFIVMESIGKTSGFKLSSIDVSKGESLAALNQAVVPAAAGSQVKAKENLPLTQNIYALNISLVFSGSAEYEDMKILLGNIEKELRIMDIESLSFSPSGNASSSEESEYNINLTTYYYKTQNP